MYAYFLLIYYLFVFNVIFIIYKFKILKIKNKLYLLKKNKIKNIGYQFKNYFKIKKK